MISFCLLSNFKLPFNTKNEDREEIISKIIDGHFNFDSIKSESGYLKREIFCSKALKEKAVRAS